MTPTDFIRCFYGPLEHQFFYADAGLLDETAEYAESPEAWRCLHPNVTDADAHALTQEMIDYGIVPGTN